MGFEVLLEELEDGGRLVGAAFGPDLPAVGLGEFDFDAARSPVLGLFLGAFKAAVGAEDEFGVYAGLRECLRDGFELEAVGGDDFGLAVVFGDTNGQSVAGSGFEGEGVAGPIAEALDDADLEFDVLGLGWKSSGKGENGKNQEKRANSHDTNRVAKSF